MEKNNTQQLQALAKIFNTDKIISQSDIAQILKGVLEIMNSFKSGNETLNAETKKEVSDLIEKAEEEYEKIVKNIASNKDSAKEEISSYASNQIALIKSLLIKIEKKKESVEKILASGVKNAKDGVDGKDADEEYIIQEIAKLIPPPKEIILDDGEKIINKINEAKEGKIKASQISDLPKFTREVIREVGAHGGAYETPIKAGTNVTIRKDASGAWVISSTASGGGGGFTYINEIVGGSGTSFTLANVPADSSKVALYGGGSRLTPGGGNDYTISGANITMANSYASGQVLADYS